MDIISTLFQEVQNQRREIADIRTDIALNRERVAANFLRMKKDMILLREECSRPRQISMTDLLKQFWFKVGIAIGATGAIYGGKLPEESAKIFVELLKSL